MAPDIGTPDIETVAKFIAVANNGGDWSENYTEEEKDVWRARAVELIEMINTPGNGIDKMVSGFEKMAAQRNEAVKTPCE